MALAIFQAHAVDDAGNVLVNPTIEVINEATAAHPSLFSNRAGSSALGNPYTPTSADGYFAFYVVGGAYQITVTKGAYSKTWRYVAIGTEGEVDTVTSTDKALARFNGTGGLIQNASGTNLDDNNNLTLVGPVSPAKGQFKVTANNDGCLSMLSYIGDNGGYGFDVDFTASGFFARNATAAMVYKLSGQLLFRGNGGLVVGNTYTPTIRAYMDIATGDFVFNSTTASSSSTVGSMKLAGGLAVVGQFNGAGAVNSMSGKLAVGHTSMGGSAGQLYVSAAGAQGFEFIAGGGTASSNLLQSYNRSGAVFTDLYISGANVFLQTTGNTVVKVVPGAFGINCGTTTPAQPFVVSDGGNGGFEFVPNAGGGTAFFQVYDRTAAVFKPFGFAAISMAFQPSGGAAVFTVNATRIDNGLPMRLKNYTVAALPSGAAGDSAYASNCRVFNGAGVQEGAGVGSGGEVNYNGTSWKIAGTNVTAVA